VIALDDAYATHDEWPEIAAMLDERRDSPRDEDAIRRLAAQLGPARKTSAEVRRRIGERRERQRASLSPAPPPRISGTPRPRARARRSPRRAARAHSDGDGPGNPGGSNVASNEGLSEGEMSFLDFLVERAVKRCLQK
jgi:hypothetical protein